MRVVFHARLASLHPGFWLTGCFWSSPRTLHSCNTCWQPHGQAALELDLPRRTLHSQFTYLLMPSSSSPMRLFQGCLQVHNECKNILVLVYYANRSRVAGGCGLTHVLNTVRSSRYRETEVVASIFTRSASRGFFFPLPPRLLKLNWIFSISEFGGWEGAQKRSHLTLISNQQYALRPSST